MKTRKNRTVKKKYYGGTDNSSINDIMRQVKKEDTVHFNLGNSPIIAKISNLLTGLTIKGIERLGGLLGVDLSNKENINKKLDQLRVVLADPRNKEKVKQIISEAARTGALMLEAAAPFIQPLVDKSIKIGSESMSKIGEAAVKIALNTAEEIPVAGVVIGTVRSLSNAGEAVLSATNAANQIMASTSDTINAASKNYERLLKEKMDSINRIDKSVENFQRPTVKQEPFTQNTNKKSNVPITNTNNKNLYGGNKRQCSRITRKTRK